MDVVTYALDEQSLNPIIPALQHMRDAGHLPSSVHIHTVSEVHTFFSLLPRKLLMWLAFLTEVFRREETSLGLQKGCARPSVRDLVYIAAYDFTAGYAVRTYVQTLFSKSASWVCLRT